MNRAIRPSASEPAIDLHSPFVFDVRSLGRRAGSLRHDQREVPAPAALGSEVIGVPEGDPMDVDIRLESVTEGVLVTGTVTATLHGQCARCLEPLTEDLVVDLQELFAWPNSVTDETTDEHEVPRIRAEHLDLEPAVRDAVVLGLPWTPVCRADCPGLCPECGARWDELPDDHSHEALDPRWEALRTLAVPGAVADLDVPPETDDRTTNRTTNRTTDRTTNRGE